MRGVAIPSPTCEPFKPNRGKVRLWLGHPVFASRYALWRFTRLVAAIWALLRRLGRSLLVQAVLATAILWQGPGVYERVSGHRTSWVAFAVIMAFAGFLVLAARSRRQTVFLDFVDCTGADAKSPGPVPGLSAYLANEVARLGALYRTVQRDSPADKGSERVDAPIQPTVELGDTAEFLKGAVSPDAKLSFGPVSIPVGSILGLVARYVKGPQITGSLHREGDRLILLARHEGGDRPKSWRVQGAAGSASDDDKGRWNLYPLVEEMAQRMLSDLTLGSKVKFRAVEAFTQAARALLEDGGLAQPRLLRMLEVKRCLLKAIAEDKSFDLAWYNLGVVLRELDETEMARAVFTRARLDNPEWWEATYALAILPGDPATRMLLCRQILRTDPGPAGEAQTYDLLGLLYGEHAGSLEGLDSGPSEPGDPDLNDPEQSGHQGVRESQASRLRIQAIESRRLAAKRAWKNLRRAERSRTDGQGANQLDAATRLAATCLTNLALSYKVDAFSQLHLAREKAYIHDERAKGLRKKRGEEGEQVSLAEWALGGSLEDLRSRLRADQNRRKQQRGRRAQQVELLLRQASKLRPMDQRAHQELGQFHEALGEYGRAVAAYSRVLRLRIDDPEAWLVLLRAAAHAKRKHQPLASEAGRALLSLAPIVPPKKYEAAADAIDNLNTQLARRLRSLADLGDNISRVIEQAKGGEAQGRIELLELAHEARSLTDGTWAEYQGWQSCMVSIPQRTSRSSYGRCSGWRRAAPPASGRPMSPLSWRSSSCPAGTCRARLITRTGQCKLRPSQPGHGGCWVTSIDGAPSWTRQKSATYLGFDGSRTAIGSLS